MWLGDESATDFLPFSCPSDAKLPAITDYDDYNVSGVYVFVHTCAVVSC